MRARGSFSSQGYLHDLVRRSLAVGGAALSGGLRVATIAACVAVAACRSNPEVSLQVNLPRDLSDAVFLEVVAYRGVSCATVIRTSQGGFPEGAASRLTFRRGEVTPAFGDLPKDTYAIAASARRDDCGVVALGCSQVNLNDARSVRVDLEPVAEVAGACREDAVCALGRCIPRDTGASCSLDLVGGGPFAPKAEGATPAIATPALAASKAGFFAVYTEMDVCPASRKPGVLLSAQNISLSGGASKPDQACIERCGDRPADDSVAIASDGDKLTVLLSRNECTDSSGFDSRTYAATGEPEQPGYTSLGNDLASVRLSPSKAAAATARGAYWLASVVRTSPAASNPSILQLSPLQRAGTDVTFAGKSLRFTNLGATDAWTTSSADLTLLAVRRTGSDAAADGSLSVFGWDPANAPRVEADLRSAIFSQPAVTFASLATLPGRGYVLFGDSGGTRLRTLTRNGASVVVQGSGEPPYDVSPFVAATAGDLVAFDVPKDASGSASTRLVIATVERGDILLRALDVGSVPPKLLRSIRLSSVGSVLQAPLRDGGVALAVNGDRVALTWSTARKLTAGEPPGGYAVFACAR